MRIAVTGATGYVGGRLVPRLLERGHELRVIVRATQDVEMRRWHRDVEVRVADLLDEAATRQALAGADAAYYLVHSFRTARYDEKDLQLAENFARAARPLSRLVYLGSLLPEWRRAPRLESRARVGAILRRDRPALELRAGPIVGSGSILFEMVRSITEETAVMIAPAWIDRPVQPIAIRDVLSILVEGIESDVNGVVEIGADPITFRSMMETYAELRDLRRAIIAIPFSFPRLSALWIGAVTPLSGRLVLPTIEALHRGVRADLRRAADCFPDVRPMDFQTAVELALRKVHKNAIETRWSDAP
ncbi:MAG: NAD(P)H-binding protein [Thermoanaerobaculia bacterium]